MQTTQNSVANHFFAEHMGPVFCRRVVSIHWHIHSWACDQQTDNLDNLFHLKQQSLILYNQYVPNEALYNLYNQYYNSIGIV